MNYYSLSSILASVFCLILAVFVYSRAGRNQITKSFAAVTALIGVWTLFPYLTNMASSTKEALRNIRIAYLAASFVPVIFYRFMIHLMEVEEESFEKTALKLSYVAAVFFALLTFNTRFIHGLMPHELYYTIQPGVFYHQFVMYFGVMYFLASSRLIEVYRQAKGARKNQLRYIGISFILAFLSGVVHFLSAYTHYEPFPHDALVILYSAIVSYALMRYRLMDIQVVIKKAVVFSVLFGLPVIVYHTILNLLHFWPYDKWIWSSIALIVAFASGIMIAFLVNRSIFQKEFSYHKALIDASKGMVTYTDPNYLVKVIAHFVNAKLKAMHTGIFVQEVRGVDRYVLKASRGVKKRKLGLRLDSSSSLVVWFTGMKTKLLATKIIADRDAETLSYEQVIYWLKDENFLSRERGLRPLLLKIKDEMDGLEANLVVPSFYSVDKLVGILVLGEKKQGLYAEADIHLLSTLANDAAIAVRNAQIYEDLRRRNLQLRDSLNEIRSLHSRQQKLFLDTASSLAEAIDRRDQYTGGHTRVVMDMCIDVAKRLRELHIPGYEIDEQKLENIRLGALLHDIGKIGIPDDILNKSSKLSDEEFNVVKQHPAIGAAILKHIEGLDEVTEVVLHHQEKYDGTGYPAGFKGSNIPLGSRIVAVVDAYHAMTSDRPYRQALKLGEAVDELRRNSGTQFDPIVVDTFLRAHLKMPEASSRDHLVKEVDKLLKDLFKK